MDHLLAAEASANSVRVDDHIDHIARVCHEANRAYCKALGDDSQLAWEQAPDWQKESARVGVNHIMLNPKSTPKDSHNSWLEQKALEGWEYGPEKDPELKLHPCFLPYEQLPVEQRAKDYIFGAIVRAMI